MHEEGGEEEGKEGGEEGGKEVEKHHAAARKAPCSIRLVDSFGGGLSQEVRETAALYNQIISEIEAKMTAALQVTDTDEAFRLKSIQRQGEKN